MKLHFPRPQIVSVAFIILSICSALYISLAGLNYLRFFPALAQVDSRVVNVIFVNGSNAVSLSSLFTVDNPTEYSGFRIQDITSASTLSIQMQRASRSWTWDSY